MQSVDRDYYSPFVPAIIKQSCPWFFEMWDLIAKRPNIVPTGLGNSESGIDMDMFGGGNNGDVTRIEYSKWK